MTCPRWEGIQFHTAARVRRIQRKDGRVVCELSDGKPTIPCEADAILVTTSIKPNTEGVSLVEAGVELTARRFVKSDAYLRTTAPGVWAAGDVSGKILLETVAAKEWAVATPNARKREQRSINYDRVPLAVFPNPQGPSVGLTDAEYVRRGDRCESRVIKMDRIPNALTLGDTREVRKMGSHADP